MGIVSHTRFFGYFELAREKYLRQRHIDPVEIMNSGYNLPLSKAGIEFINPLRFGDIAMIEVQLEKASRIKLNFKYHLVGKRTEQSEEILFALGWTEHIFTDSNLNIRKIPPQLYHNIEADRL